MDWQILEVWQDDLADDGEMADPSRIQVWTDEVGERFELDFNEEEVEEGELVNDEPDGEVEEWKWWAHSMERGGSSPIQIDVFHALKKWKAVDAARERSVANRLVSKQQVSCGP
ncbi:hypothetical protein NDU88_001855 [Pleurodeles waltl]|uniref:Uncharacterized protein n=1 Tax=Pleurodeles waltl TaxID=8319 RepID=A0AAV7LEC9_PLEWA|nr:hypothetical protein NDU88_001855 [Pleurodeles waltl]